MNLFSQATKVIQKYEKHFAKSDIFLRKDFYKNILKVSIYKNQNLKTELEQVLEMIDLLEQEIQDNNEEILNEAADDEKKEEVSVNLRQSIFQIERIIDNLTRFDIHQEERETIQDFARRLENETDPFEALFVVLNRNHTTDLPTFMDNINRVSTFQYKNERLYQREHPYQDLSKTIMEHIIQEEQEIAVDFKEDQVELRDIITNKTYTELGFKTLLGFPLFLDKELFGCAIFVSEKDLTDDKNYITLKIAAKILEFRLSTIYFQNSLRTHRNILQVAINRLQDGIFYYEMKRKRFSISDRLAQYLQLSKYSLSTEDFESLIHPADKRIYLDIVENARNLSNPYEVTYRISVNDTYKHVKETGDPFLTKEGEVNFYIGSLQELEDTFDVDVSNMPYRDYNQFLEYLKQLKKQTANVEFKFSFVRVVIYNLFDLEPSANEILTFISNVFQQELSITDQEIFRLTDNSLIISVLDCIDKRTLLRYMNTISRVIKEKGKQNYRYRNIQTKFVITRFPRDAVKVEDVFEFTDKGIQYATEEEILFFDNEIYQKHLEQQNMQSSMMRFIKENSQDFLLQPVKQGEYVVGHMFGYNIKGIMDYKQVRHNIDKATLMYFEEYIIKYLIDGTTILSSPVYVKVSLDTLFKLLEDKTLGVQHKNKFIKLLIDKNSFSNVETTQIIHRLRDLGFPIGFSYSLLQQMSIAFLSEKMLEFVDMEHYTMDRYHKIFKLFETVDIILLGSKLMTFYENSYIYLDQYKKFREVFPS